MVQRKIELVEVADISPELSLMLWDLSMPLVLYLTDRYKSKPVGRDLKRFCMTQHCHQGHLDAA